MSDHVWICTAPSDPTLSDIVTTTDVDNNRILEIAPIARKGGVLGADQLPTEASGAVGGYRLDQFGEHWPDLSHYAGLWILSERASNVIRGFDLGSGLIRPLRLHDTTSGTPASGTWFIWNIGNLKEALLPERSQNLRPAAGRAFALLDARDHDVKCMPEATTGPDIWIDPKLRHAIFLSAALGQALIDAGLATEQSGFGTLIRCDVTDA